MRLVDRRFGELDLLEAAGQRAVALEEALVVVVRGGADAAQLPGGERRLQDVGGVERAAAGGAGPDHGVDFVDEENRPRLFLERAEHVLQTLLEVAAEPRTGEQRAHVEGVDVGAANLLGYFASEHLEREAFGERGLADTGIADEHRVVLAPAAEHPDRPLAFLLAADQGIDLPLRGLLDQIHREGLQRLLVGARRAGFVGFGFFAFAGRLPCIVGQADLRDAVREVADDIEPGNALLREQECRVRFGLAEQGHENVLDVDLFLARRLHVGGGPLHDPLEAERLL